MRRARASSAERLLVGVAMALDLVGHPRRGVVARRLRRAAGAVVRELRAEAAAEAGVEQLGDRRAQARAALDEEVRRQLEADARVAAVGVVVGADVAAEAIEEARDDVGRVW